jgi:hypothetical protein
MAKWKRDDMATRDLLLIVGIDASRETIAQWSDRQVKAAEAWAGSAHLRASDNYVRVPNRPSFLPEPWGGPELTDCGIFNGPTETRC